MSHAEQLEREAEQTRAQIASTLDELRACVTPGHVVDQLANRMSEGAAAAFARNLKDQAVRNPMPLALMGASLAWLMLSGRSTEGGIRRAGERLRDDASDTAESMRDAADQVGKAAADKSREWSDQASRVGSDTAESMSSTVEDAKRAVSQAGDRLRDTAGSMTDSAQKTASETGEAVRDTAGSAKDSVQRSTAASYEALTDTARRTASSITKSTKVAGQRTLQTGNTFLDFCREQPMLLTGLGIAVGALVGALLPATEAENRLMGETSDSLKERAQDLASDQVEDAKKVGERALDAAADETLHQAAKEEGAAQEATANDATLVPRSETSERETRGQPWTADNAPL
ncbi:MULTISPECIES: DUF3618 domain-containing protein [unclassified Bradyrhizobium]|uniref:DUF3618 domain-containing protein n=1 Tax=unclassified Bradyrhizobium TaxID=2631580 RepID=UPI002478DF66|nr:MULTISPECIES: DUF3618 domain-containing protein [unclassified Bradyrhizobium]WGR72656.1 DUF3618 domain-containing protein [Bradyrhizobium sp. ISRA426]WGR77489.1 DUF3618 domain-containing protein [Bradyrhizobium sp. ISRA430]WGR87895.1 DUF3618 domain-containing protein [Bradyrhizobium sp. ISRA432]